MQLLTSERHDVMPELNKPAVVGRKTGKVTESLHQCAKEHNVRVLDGHASQGGPLKPPLTHNTRNSAMPPHTPRVGTDKY